MEYIIEMVQPSQHTLYGIANYYRKLPAAFGRQFAISEVGKPMYLRPRTCDKYLAILVECQKLQRVAAGEYRKIG